MSVAVRKHALRTGERTDLAAFALLTAVLKLASALFGGAVGLALDGFRAGAPGTAFALGGVVIVGGLGFLTLFAPRRVIPKSV
jgi:Na+/melibiose symporter-like transporter